MVRQMTGVSKAKYVAEFVRILLESGETRSPRRLASDVYDIWLKELAEFKPVMYTGSERDTQKEKAKEAFVDGKTNLFIISLRSGIGLMDFSSGVRRSFLGVGLVPTGSPPGHWPPRSRRAEKSRHGDLPLQR